MAAVADLQAILVLTYLTWAAVSVSGTTPELSTTTGDTVNIPCLFGESTSYIFIGWYYIDSTGRRIILKHVNEDLIIGVEYENRASLQADYPTLNLKRITVADEGTYQCVVDSQKLTVVSKFETKLNVFSLRPDTLPVISPCTLVDDSPSCIIHANQSFNLTCTLPNVYPVEDTELIWYQDGHNLSSIYDDTRNDDGTTNFSQQIQISQTGNFTCNATYHSANGKEKTGISVKAWIKPPPDTPRKKLSTGQIVGIFMVLLVVGIFILLFICRSKVKGQRSSTNAELIQVWVETSTKERKRLGKSAGNGSTDNNAASSEPTKRLTADRSQRIEEELTQLGTSDENGSQDNNAASSDPTKRPTAERSKNIEEELTQLGTSDENGSQDNNVDFSVSLPSSTLRRRNVMRMSSVVIVDFDGILKEIAKALSKDTEIDDLGGALGFKPSDIHRYINANAQQGGSYMGTLDMLRTWRKGQTTLTERAELRSALLRARCVSLADEYLSSSNPGQQQETATGSSSSAMSVPTSTSRREVTDEEIYNLSRLLPDGKYNRLGSVLGFPYTYLDKILKKRLNDTTAAFEEVLHEWKNKGKSMEDLDAALKKADLGEFVPKYKN